MPVFELDAPTRRRFLLALSGLCGVTGVSAQRSEPQAASAHAMSPALAEAMANLKRGNETICILIYPGFTAIDAIGPQYLLSGMMGASVKLVAKTAAPVRCETGFDVVPNLTFEQCPSAPSLLMVPGGTTGALEAMADEETLGFIRRVGGAAEMAGSVCTGSLLLGAAGLLNGYEATSHWQTLDLLKLVGAKPSTKRVVFDRNRVTGAGVTAGLDFALELVKHYRGDFYAKGMQLLAQYDPQPLFAGGGNPNSADKTVVNLMNEMHQPFVDLAASTIRTAQDGGKKSLRPDK